MSDPVTIATWNLECPGSTGTARTQAILQQLRQINADIWILTETNQQLSLPGYDSLATPDMVRHQRRQGERTTMIWARWPLQPVPVFPALPAHEERPRTAPSYAVSSQDTVPAVCALVELPGQPLLVYGTVIAHFGDRGPQDNAAYHSVQRAAFAAHHQEWQRIRLAYPTMPLVVAGDFNVNFNEPTRPSQAIYAALVNALADAQLTCVTRCFTIDHICLSADLAAQVQYVTEWQQAYGDEHRAQFRPVSDHKGVIVTLAGRSAGSVLPVALPAVRN